MQNQQKWLKENNLYLHQAEFSFLRKKYPQILETCIQANLQTIKKRKKRKAGNNTQHGE